MGKSKPKPLVFLPVNGKGCGQTEALKKPVRSKELRRLVNVSPTSLIVACRLDLRDSTIPLAPDLFLMRYFVWFLVLLLIVLHQDNWFWEDSTLVFGVIPVGLFYHACISLAASCTWFLATCFAWPSTGEDTISRETEGDAEG